ncbi:mandelate racemase/muconate lactonizing enzyme family protein [Nonomuraea sp. NPDC050404]|uniref:mandelate racemase/muconate lactonizing enzyme family protein n=1 Tax=Nonomuraea sp. NPDC050404 TaxID=3155783 RepID=UPI0033F83119
MGDANGVVADGVTEVPIVLVETDAGVTGTGFGPGFELDQVFSAIEGEDPRSVTALYDRMLDRVFKAGHAGAVFGTIGALDTALWDIKAKLAGEPLWRLLGARTSAVHAYASGLDIGLSDDELAMLYARYAERGLRAAKLKGGLDVEKDLRRLKVVRDVLSDAGRPALMLDVNESWSRGEAVRHVAEIETAVDLTWIEEPVRRWDAEGLAAVGRGIRASVASGENLTGLEQYRPLLAAGSVGVVQAGAAWGITHFLRVSALAHGHDLPVSPVGSAPNWLAHAAAAVPNHLVCELQDLAMPVGIGTDWDVADGAIVLGSRPGHGIEVDEAAITAFRASAGWRAPAGPHVRPRDAGLRLFAR